MGSISTPKTWVPYVNTQDCSQGFCSIYCPQWCYIIFPPPPPFDFPDDNSGPNFSPLVIAIIGILATAFLLVSYYAIISKYCKNRDPSRRGQNHAPNPEVDENRDPSSSHGPWNGATNGLNEAMIKKITVFKFRKGDGLSEGADCPVCLSEFQENESLRLLPKCSHAFHVNCIDSWLKSHSNCPLCRANIAFIATAPNGMPPPVMEAPPLTETPAQLQLHNAETTEMEEDIEMGVRDQESDDRTASGRAHSNQGGEMENPRTVIDLRGNETEEIRRSVSMDNPFQGRLLSIADVLRSSDDEEYRREFHGEVGTSRTSTGQMSSSSSSRNKVLHCVSSPVAMKRSVSNGRFSFSKRGRGKNTLIPL